MLFKLLLSVALLLVTIVHYSKADCSILIDKRMTGASNYDNWPLVLDPIIPNFFPLGPNPGEIFLINGHMLRLACPGENNGFVSIPLPTNVIIVTCLGEKDFDYQGSKFNFYSFSCLMIPKSSVITMERVKDDIARFGIGFQITENEFVPLIISNYNIQTQNVMFATHTIYRLSNKKQTSSRTDFLNDMHPVPYIENLYEKSTVYNIMDTLIGEEKRENYFEGQSFLVKGHLAAKADFPFAAQQTATFYYLNCFPQFQGFNNANWKALENNIRSHDFFTDVEVTTTAESILYLPNERNQMTFLYLINGMQFPIPQLVHKSVTVSFNNVQTVYRFTGVNHPNIDSNEFDNLIDGFEDLCDEPEYSWLGQSLRNIENRRNPRKGLFICHRPLVIQLPVDDIIMQ